MADRRRHPRLKLSCSLRLRRPGESHTIVTHTENVNCQGFYFASEHAFKPSDSLECELVIHGGGLASESDVYVIVRGSAEVVRIVPHEPRQGFGVGCRLEVDSVTRNASGLPGAEKARMVALSGQPPTSKPCVAEGSGKGGLDRQRNATDEEWNRALPDERPDL